MALLTLVKVDQKFERGHHLICQDQAPGWPLACYAVLDVATLPAEYYQPLSRWNPVQVPYTGKLYTLEEIVCGAWIPDFR